MRGSHGVSLCAARMKGRGAYGTFDSCFQQIAFGPDVARDSFLDSWGKPVRRGLLDDQGDEKSWSGDRVGWVRVGCGEAGELGEVGWVGWQVGTGSGVSVLVRANDHDSCMDALVQRNTGYTEQLLY